MDSADDYILVMPGDMEGTTRRGKLRKDESLLLLTLRIMWEEGSRDGEMDGHGRILIDTDSLLDRLTTLGGGEAPANSRLREMLALWKSKGFVRVGEEDREEEIIPVTITPAIQHLVTPDLVKEIEDFLDRHEPEGDVFSSIEENRRRAEEIIQSQIAKRRAEDSPAAEQGELNIAQATKEEREEMPHA